MTDSKDWRGLLTASERYDNIQRMCVFDCFPVNAHLLIPRYPAQLKLLLPASAAPASK